MKIREFRIAAVGAGSDRLEERVVQFDGRRQVPVNAERLPPETPTHDWLPVAERLAL